MKERHRDYYEKIAAIITIATERECAWCFGRSIHSVKEILSDATILEGFAVQEHELEGASGKMTELISRKGKSVN